jgi:hypothetical protein
MKYTLTSAAVAAALSGLNVGRFEVKSSAWIAWRPAQIRRRGLICNFVSGSNEAPMLPDGIPLRLLAHGAVRIIGV